MNAITAAALLVFPPATLAAVTFSSTLVWDYVDQGQTGFKTACGPASGTYTISAPVPGGSSARSQLVGPAINNTYGTWYCVGYALGDSTHGDSGPSNEVSFSILPTGLDLTTSLGPINLTAILTPQPITNTSTIWSRTTVPGIADSGPDNAVEVGVKFTADVNGRISGIRFYKGTGNTGTHVGSLWSSSGTKLASATFTNETASGWQQANFATGVAITANTVYVASYHTDVGHYSDDQNYFATKGVDSPPLHALQNSTSSFNGVFIYNSTSSFPTQGWNSSNYWVDVVFNNP